MRLLNSLFVIIAALSLIACSDNGDYPTDNKFMPVMLEGSTRWSILNIENGEIVAKDVFADAPSAIVDDMFFVTDSLGSIDYFNVNNVKTPVNKEKYGSATLFNNGKAIVSKPGEPLTIIDKQGNVLVNLPQTIDRAMMFMHDRALVHADNGKFGFINTQGDTVSAINYSYAAAFLYDNLAVVSRSSSPTDSVNDITAIDINGKELFSLSSEEYQLISPYFTDGVLPVAMARQDSVVFFDKNGKPTENPTAAPKVIKDAGYKDGTLTRGGLYIALKGDRVGLVDKDNKTLIPFKYDAIIDLSKTRYIVRNDSTCILVDENGKQIGNAKFTNFVTPNYTAGAVRGIVDTAMLAANLMQLFNDKHACGAAKGATLMDLNSLVGSDPTPFVGRKILPQMMGQLAVLYFFDDDLAKSETTADGQSAPQFNLNDRINQVSMSYDMHQCTDASLQEMVAIIESALGTNGFVLDHDNIFVSDNGTAVTLGYSHGILNINYFMNPADAKPQIRQNRP